MKIDRYFPHDTLMRQTPEIIVLIEKENASGYGMYWVILEYLRTRRHGQLLGELLPLGPAGIDCAINRFLGGTPTIGEEMGTIMQSPHRTRSGFCPVRHRKGSGLGRRIHINRQLHQVSCGTVVVEPQAVHAAVDIRIGYHRSIAAADNTAAKAA